MSETALRLHLQKVDPKGAEERARRWAEENAEAIKAYNERIERNGSFGDDLKTWSARDLAGQASDKTDNLSTWDEG